MKCKNPELHALVRSRGLEMLDGFGVASDGRLVVFTAWKGTTGKRCATSKYDVSHGPQGNNAIPKRATTRRTASRLPASFPFVQRDLTQKLLTSLA